jgi:hypothetical protein
VPLPAIYLMSGQSNRVLEIAARCRLDVWGPAAGMDSAAMALPTDAAGAGAGTIIVHEAQPRGATARAGRSEGSWRTMLANSITLQVSKSGSRRFFMQSQ